MAVSARTVARNVWRWMGFSRSSASGVPAFRGCAARRDLAVPDEVELVRRARGFAAERSARDCRVVRRISVPVLRAPMVAIRISWCTVSPRKSDSRLQDLMRSVNVLFNFFGPGATKKVLQNRKSFGNRMLRFRARRNRSRLPVPRPGAVAHPVQVVGPSSGPAGRQAAGWKVGGRGMQPETASPGIQPDIAGGRHVQGSGDAGGPGLRTQ